MFGKHFVKELVEHSTDNATDRRLFLKSAGAAGLGVLGVAAVTALPGGSAAEAATHSASAAADAQPSDGAILNFALNLEYLEGEFYHHAVFGEGLPNTLTDGKGGRGAVTGGRKVPFKSAVARRLADEIASDERLHVKFLREALGSTKVGRPTIDIRSSFTAAARAAGVIKAHETFDPYANENNFLLAAFIFEDVGVTAYKGAAPLINNPSYVEAAAGILAVEAYHASAIRTLLFERGLGETATKIARARDLLDGKRPDDRGVLHEGKFALAPTNRFGQVYSRSPGRVLNVVYLTPHTARKGGFFPDGVRGSLNTSDGS